MPGEEKVDLEASGANRWRAAGLSLAMGRRHLWGAQRDWGGWGCGAGERQGPSRWARGFSLMILPSPRIWGPVPMSPH